MDGRHRLPPHATALHYPPPPPHHSLAGGPPPPPPHHSILAALEDRIAFQHHDIQQLLADNERLAATHVALKQDLAASHRDLRLFADSAGRAKADGDVEIRGLYDRSLRAEEEARRVEAMRAELAVVRSDVSRLGKDRDELVEKVEKLRAEVAKVRGETGKVDEVMWEINCMRNEIERGRAAVEYEKKAHAENFEQSQVMQKNMVSMSREAEKLRAELANAEKRARAAAAATAAAKLGPAYAESYGKNEMAYGGSTYASTYGVHQAQRGADGGSQYGPQYGSGAVPHGSYDIQQTYVQR